MDVQTPKTWCTRGKLHIFFLHTCSLHFSFPWMWTNKNWKYKQTIWISPVCIHSHSRDRLWIYCYPDHNKAVTTYYLSLHRLLRQELFYVYRTKRGKMGFRLEWCIHQRHSNVSYSNLFRLELYQNNTRITFGSIYNNLPHFMLTRHAS